MIAIVHANKPELISLDTHFASLWLQHSKDQSFGLVNREQTISHKLN